MDVIDRPALLDVEPEVSGYASASPMFCRFGAAARQKVSFCASQRGLALR